MTFKKLRPDPPKIYGAANISRHCKEMAGRVDHRAAAETSIADKPHTQSREAERRRRQMERQQKKGKHDV